MSEMSSTLFSDVDWVLKKFLIPDLEFHPGIKQELWISFKKAYQPECKKPHSSLRSLLNKLLSNTNRKKETHLLKDLGSPSSAMMDK